MLQTTRFCINIAENHEKFKWSPVKGSVSRGLPIQSPVAGKWETKWRPAQLEQSWMKCMRNGTSCTAKKAGTTTNCVAKWILCTIQCAMQQQFYGEGPGVVTRPEGGMGVESVVSSHRGMARSCGDALTGEVWRDRSGSECSSLPSTPPHSCWQPRVAPLYINQLMFCTINQLIRPRGVCVSCRVFPAQVARSDLENQ